MNCTKFELQLREAAELRTSLEPRKTEPSSDGSSTESSPLGELRTHAEQCSQCRRRWDEFELLDRVISMWKPLVPEVDLTDAVLLAVASAESDQAADAPPAELLRPVQPDSPDSGTRRIGRTGIALVAIAGIVAALLLITSRLSPVPPGDDEVANVEVDPATRELQLQIAANPPPIDDLLSDAGNAYQLVATDTATVFRDSVNLFKPTASVVSNAPQPTAKSPAVLRRLTDTIPGRIEKLGRELKPIGSGVASATGFLLNVIPFNDTPAT